RGDGGRWAGQTRPPGSTRGFYRERGVTTMSRARLRPRRGSGQRIVPSNPVRRSFDPFEICRDRLVLLSHGESEVGVVRLRPAPRRALVHHEVTAARDHGLFESVERVVDGHELVDALVSGEPDPARPQAIGGLAGRPFQVFRLFHTTLRGRCVHRSSAVFKISDRCALASGYSRYCPFGLHPAREPFPFPIPNSQFPIPYSRIG